VHKIRCDASCLIPVRGQTPCLIIEEPKSTCILTDLFVVALFKGADSCILYAPPNGSKNDDFECVWR
jgi:hypothetical protein